MTSKEKKISQFIKNGLTHANGQIFGMPLSTDECDLVLLPVPWEATTSYGEGTASGPAAILEASYQLDLYDSHFPEACMRGIGMLEISNEWLERSKEEKAKALEVISLIEMGKKVEDSPAVLKKLKEVNAASDELNKWVSDQTRALLSKGKLVGLVGGEHSTPYGFIQSLAEVHDEFGILQIDAHADLREAYEGFTHSHASIMFNVLKDIAAVKHLTQVGVRDISLAEADMIRSRPETMHCFYDDYMKEKMYNGTRWAEVCDEIISTIPQKVYLSFDVDGLDPSLCPHTGTPVPGGLQFSEAIFLVHKLVESGRKIIGFDLVEVAPGNNDWNGNVGARILYKLCCATAG